MSGGPDDYALSVAAAVLWEIVDKCPVPFDFLADRVFLSESPEQLANLLRENFPTDKSPGDLL